MINWRKIVINATKSRASNRPLLGGFVLVGRRWDARIEAYRFDEDQFLIELITFKHCTNKACGYVTINNTIGTSMLDTVEATLKQAFSVDGVPSFCGMRGLIHAYIGKNTKVYSFGNNIWRMMYGDDYD